MYNQRRVAEAAVVPGTREPPPPELNEKEAAHWNTIINRLPQDWFSPENHCLLKELCRHIGHSDALSIDIENVRKELAILAVQEAADIEEIDKIAKAIRRATALYHALLRLQAFQSERIGNLATKLRLSQQTRTVPSKAAAKAAEAPLGLKPWQGWDQAPEARQ